MNLTFLTSNKHKFQEMSTKLSPLGIELEQYPMGYPETQADTILDVARYSLSLMVPVLSGDFLLEDAGLHIDALDGFPGPYSSYVFDKMGWRGILKLLDGEENRRARFISVIGLYHDGAIHFFEGVCEGDISLVGRGEYGFGYDPIFVPHGYDESFAELDLKTKNTISHRARSTDMLSEYFQALE